jgi:hypothetical protein
VPGLGMEPGSGFQFSASGGGGGKVSQERITEYYVSTNCGEGPLEGHVTSHANVVLLLKLCRRACCIECATYQASWWLVMASWRYITRCDGADDGIVDGGAGVVVQIGTGFEVRWVE